MIRPGFRSRADQALRHVSSPSPTVTIFSPLPGITVHPEPPSIRFRAPSTSTGAPVLSIKIRWIPAKSASGSIPAYMRVTSAKSSPCRASRTISVSDSLIMVSSGMPLLRRYRADGDSGVIGAAFFQIRSAILNIAAKRAFSRRAALGSRSKTMGTSAESPSFSASSLKFPRSPPAKSVQRPVSVSRDTFNPFPPRQSAGKRRNFPEILYFILFLLKKSVRMELRFMLMCSP